MALQQISENTSLNVYGVAARVPDVPRIILKKNKVYTFVRDYIFNATFSSTIPVGVGLGVTLTLNDAPNSSEITSLFDQYRLAQATATYFPISGAATTIYSALDYDDSNTPTFADLLQKDSFQANQSTQSFSRTIVPAVTSQIYAGVITTAYGIEKLVWLDSATSTVPHYGFKYFMQSPSTGTTVGQILISLVIQGRSLN
jgi:hypothetical protein